MGHLIKLCKNRNDNSQHMHPNYAGFSVGGAAAAAVLLLCVGGTLIKTRCSRLNGAAVQEGTVQPPVDQAEPPPDRASREGLPSTVIRSMPAFKFRERTRGGNAGGMMINECVICLGEFRQDEWLKLLPNCDHVFHVYCVDAWLRANPSCPLCRRSALCDVEGSASIMAQLEALRREDANRERSLGDYYRLDLDFIIPMSPLEPRSAIYR